MSLVAGCSSNPVDLRPGGTPPTGNPTVQPTSGPTTAPSGAPTSRPTARPTATPTARPTATPAPTATPTVAPLACSAPAVAVPGTYTSVVSEGNVAGTTYTQASGVGIFNQWSADLYTTATPAPTPTPGPTTTPGPTPAPTTTPAPVTYVIYSGVYSVPGFSGTGISGTSFTTAATQGCALVFTRADGAPIGGGTTNALANGAPQTSVLTNQTAVGFGNIAAFSITNLGAASGSGTFTLDNGTSGTVTIQSRTVVTLAKAREMLRRFLGARRSRLH